MFKVVWFLNPKTSPQKAISILHLSNQITVFVKQLYVTMIVSLQYSIFALQKVKALVCIFESHAIVIRLYDN